MSQQLTPQVIQMLRQQITEGTAPNAHMLATYLVNALDTIENLRKQSEKLASMEHSEECLEPWKCKAGCCTFLYDELIDALKKHNIPIPGEESFD